MGNICKKVYFFLRQMFVYRYVRLSNLWRNQSFGCILEFVYDYLNLYLLKAINICTLIIINSAKYINH